MAVLNIHLARRALGVGRWAGVVAAIACLATAAAWAQATATPAELVTVVTKVDHSEANIGDPIRYTMEIASPSNAKVLIPVFSGTLGDFSITDLGDAPTKQENGRTIVTRWYTLSAFSVGEHLIPAAKVKYVVGDQEQEATGNEQKVTIVSLLDKQPNATDIRDIKPVEELPFDWRPIWLGAASLAALLLIAGIFYYVLNRPKRKYVVPPTPPHEVALNALTKLRARRYIEEGRFETFYVELSAIARRYLEDRFNVRAPEMTTEEFLVAAGSDPRLSPQQRRLLGDFLSQADLVKFARHLPALQDTEAAFEAARRFVEETRPTATPGKEVPRAAA